MPLIILPGPKIYNLFPRLAGAMNQWSSHFERIKNLEFDWVFINPFHYPGFSGSLYAPKDYYDINPLFIDNSLAIKPRGQLENMVKEAHRFGLKIMMDLVINHTSKDHPFINEHLEWYKKNESGDIKSPGAWDNGKWIEWGDLAEIDNEASRDRESLWKYWKKLVLFYINIGFDGFRADAAYQIPGKLWKELIPAARDVNPEVQFFAESLGCSPEQTLTLAQSGFDFIFNSSKWWNYSDPWLLEQLKQTREISPSISFPESHDTMRLSIESGENLVLVKQRTIFTALFSTGWMMPMGFEFGFRKKMDVCKTMPEDFEKINYDLTDLIKYIHQIRSDYQLFNKECRAEILQHSNQDNVLILKRSLENCNDKFLFVLNKDNRKKQPIVLTGLKEMLNLVDKEKAIEINFEKPNQIITEDLYEKNLEPSEIIVLYFGE